MGDGTAISVTLANDSEKGPDGLPAPIEGVTLTVTSDDGVEVGEDVTDVDGKANIPLPGAGTYTVTLDEDTLPEEHRARLRHPDRARDPGADQRVRDQRAVPDRRPGRRRPASPRS